MSFLLNIAPFGGGGEENPLMLKLPAAPGDYIKANKMPNDKFLVNRAPRCTASPGLVTEATAGD